MNLPGTSAGRAKHPIRSSRGAAADSSPQRELWVQAGNVCEPRTGDKRFSAAPPGLAQPGSPTPGSRPGLLSSAPPVLRQTRPSSSTGRARHSVRAVGSPAVPDAMGLRRRAEDCPPYHLRSRSGEHPTSTGKRAFKASERGLPGRSGRNRSQAIRRFPTQPSVRKRCGPEGRTPKTSPDHPVPHPCHPRDLWADVSPLFTTSCSFVFIRG